MQEGKPLRKLVLDHSVFGLALQGERLYTTSLDNNNPVLSYSAISSTLKPRLFHLKQPL